MPDKKKPAKKKAGRPTIYNEKLALLICERIQEGESLRAICRDDDMPDRGTIFNWTMTNEIFFSQYAQAMDIRLETRMEELQDLCDEALTDSPAKVQAYKLKIDTLKWEASKLKSKKYGDKLELEHSGSVYIVDDIK